MQLSSGSPVFCGQFHPSFPLFAVGTVAGELQIYHFQQNNWSIQRTVQHNCAITALVFSTRYLAHGLSDGTTYITFLESESMSSESKTTTVVVPPVDAGVSKLLWINSEQLLIAYTNGHMLACNVELKVLFSFREFDDSVSDMALAPDGLTFYATSGGFIGQFNILRADHGSRLLAMSDQSPHVFEAVHPMCHGQYLIVACDIGVVVFNQDDLRAHCARLEYTKLSALIPYDETFFLAGGESGHVLVGRVSPLKWIGVLAKCLNEDGEALEIDQIEINAERSLIVAIDNSDEKISIIKLDKIAEMLSSPEEFLDKSFYAEFMDEL